MTQPTEEELEALGIANELIKARTELAMTQAELAERSGISRSAIKGYESGRNMPGSRELKALCRVLQITPNVLLFGTDAPFADPALDPSRQAGLRLLLSDGEDRKRARMHIAVLSELLTADEVGSLLNLIQALATARHGAEAVAQRRLGADFMTGTILGMEKAMAKTAIDGTPPPPEFAAEVLEDFMDRKGHGRKESE